jgi:hypothetical protein
MNLQNLNVPISNQMILNTGNFDFNQRLLFLIFTNL